MGDNVLALTFPAGAIKPNITSVALVNNTAKEILTTVPTGKTWILHLIQVKNPDDVARTVLIEIWNEAAKTNHLAYLFEAAIAAAAIHKWPQPFHATSTQYHWHGFGYPLPLKEGMTIRVNYAAGGASTGGTDADGLIIYITEL